MARVPIIDITDLYHPPQDPGDNFDLIMAYALPEIDLRAVVLDVTERFRQPYAGDASHHDRRPIVRDPGIIPMHQLNAIFGRSIPFAVAPFQSMTSPDDRMDNAPRFQQSGVELILDTLRSTEGSIDVLSFGSTRALAVAYNREPDLLRSKIRRVHISAGATTTAFHEWNVRLEPHGFVRLLRSDLPLAIYPCATSEGPFGYDRHNSFWSLPDLRFVERMHPMLRRYLGFAIGNVERVDFLRALERDLPSEVMEHTYTRQHNVWETAVWAQVADRRFVRRADGAYRIVPGAEVQATDTVLPNELRPCTVAVRDDGHFNFELIEAPSNVLIYDRGDPLENERALREALPELYLSFQPKGW